MPSDSEINQFDTVNPYFWVMEGFKLSVGLFANATCLLNVIFKLKINVYILRILKVATVGTLVCQITGVVSLICVNVLKSLNVTWCSAIVVPKMINGLIVTHFTMAIAVIRYYLATKTALVEAINHTLIRGFINTIGCLIIVYTIGFVLSMTLATNYPLGFMVAYCSGKELAFEPLTAGIMSTAIASVGIGLWYDMAMIRFLRARNRIAPMAMVVWSTGSQPINPEPGINNNNAAGFRLTIPIKATLIGSSFLVLAILIAGATVTSFKTQSVSLFEGIAYSSLFLFYDIYMPLIVFLATKSNNKRQDNRNNVIPPAGLQFHD